MEILTLAAGGAVTSEHRAALQWTEEEAQTVSHSGPCYHWSYWIKARPYKGQSVTCHSSKAQVWLVLPATAFQSSAIRRVVRGAGDAVVVPCQ